MLCRFLDTGIAPWHPTTVGHRLSTLLLSVYAWSEVVFIDIHHTVSFGLKAWILSFMLELKKKTNNKKKQKQRRTKEKLKAIKKPFSFDSLLAKIRKHNRIGISVVGVCSQSVSPIGNKKKVCAKADSNSVPLLPNRTGFF